MTIETLVAISIGILGGLIFGVFFALVEIAGSLHRLIRAIEHFEVVVKDE